jgi:hypothetical protein
MALLQGSLAIDAGKSFGLPNDQRGFTRIIDQPFLANASGGDGTDIGSFELQTAPLGIASAVSRKTQGTAGTFDITLPGVECRSGGANNAHIVILTFNNSLTGAGPCGVTQGIGNVSSSAIGSDPHQYVVNLFGVTNAQTISLSLTSLDDSAGNHVNQLGLSIGVLLGDANGDSVVNSADATVVRNRSGQTADGSDFRADCNADGVINSADATVVRAHSGSSIPPSPAANRFRHLTSTVLGDRP